MLAWVRARSEDNVLHWLPEELIRQVAHFVWAWRQPCCFDANKKLKRRSNASCVVTSGDICSCFIATSQISD
jgi:hypothetical protein